jgi:pimeloyl-ACP methyl ester carboxylesterase
VCCRRVTALVALAGLGAVALLAGCRAVRAERGEVGDRDEVTVPGGAAAGIRMLRIRYGSVDVDGDPSVVSALVALPGGDAPEGGWPVVAYAHGTTGAGDGCDPSHDPSLAGVGAALGALAGAGYVAVATDYEGIGTRGPHPYLHGPSEAQAVVDSVLAARSMVEGDASTGWAVVGHSQGGHAALFTAQLAEELAPDLTLVGAVAIAPAADPAALVDAIGSAAAALLVNGWLAVDGGADTDGLLTDEGAALVDAAEDECVIEPGTQVFREGASSPGFDAYLAENVAAQEPATAPVLVVQGADDDLTPPAVARDAVARLCDLGSTVALREYRGADHLTVVESSAGDVADWLADRFAGEPAASDC